MINQYYSPGGKNVMELLKPYKSFALESLMEDYKKGLYAFNIRYSDESGKRVYIPFDLTKDFIKEAIDAGEGNEWKRLKKIVMKYADPGWVDEEEVF